MLILKINLSICFFLCNSAFGQINYLDSIRTHSLQIISTKKKIDSFAKFVSLSIMMHSPSAKKSLGEFDSLSKTDGNPWPTGLALLYKAYYATEFNNNDIQALELSTEALNLFKENNLKSGVIMANNKLAFLFLWDQIGNKNITYKEDIYLKYLTPSLALAQEIRDTDLIINTLDFIGSYCNVTDKNYALASHYFDLGEKLISKNTSPEIELGILGSIVINDAEKGDETHMLQYLKKCETLPYFNIFGYASNNMYRSVAQYYLNKKPSPNLLLSLDYAKKAFAISKNMNAPKYLSLSENRLYEVYTAMHKNDSALFYLQMHNIHEDSLQHQKFESYLINYSIQKKENIIIQQQNYLNKKNYFIYSILSLFFITGFIFRMIFINRKKNQQLQIQQIALEKEQAINKAKEEERKRIIADLHDDVGGGLSSILMISDLILKQDNHATEIDKYASKISKITKDVSNKMKTIVWAFNTDNDNLQLLCEYINQYGCNFFENSNIEFNCKFPENVQMYSLSGLQRKNIFLSVKEAINNVYKHSNAKKSWVEFSIEKNMLSISINDDGQGILDKKQFGNGLKNIAKRIEEIGGKIKIDSKEITMLRLCDIELQKL